MIRMIVTDLDGTLLAGGNNIPEENISALARAMEAGVRVVLCSGRMVEATCPIWEKVRSNAPMVLFNGAMVYDGENDEILRGHTIPRETALAVLREVEARGCYVQAFPGRGYYLEKANEWTAYYSGKIGVQGIETGRKLSAWLDTDVYKLLCLGKPEQLALLARELGPKFPDVCFVKSAETHLEIVAAGVDKSTGLRELGEILGISPQEMIGFGDEANDLPMLSHVGTVYVMENAPENVRREVRLVAPRNTQAGLAKIVNLCLNEGRMGRG
ncbi:MAG: HAD family phosphatase [Clostridia bacterium]|nr:HAD family phosphatase [Clostridia bacterium]